MGRGSSFASFINNSVHQVPYFCAIPLTPYNNVRDKVKTIKNKDIPLFHPPVGFHSLYKLTHIPFVPSKVVPSKVAIGK